MACMFIFLMVAALLVLLAPGGVTGRPTIDERISKAKEMGKGKDHAYGLDKVLTELDILWDKDVYDALQERIHQEKGQGKERRNREQRGAMFTASGTGIGKWPNNNVFYEFEAGTYTDAEKNLIRSVMKMWADKTCIKFTESTTATNRLKIMNHGGCYSLLGWQGGVQIFSLAKTESATCLYKDIILHELGHALGMIHEHNRPDRDDYVTIMWANVQFLYRDEFLRYPESYVGTFGVPYDYESIMHYGPTTLAFDPSKPTIVTTYPSKQNVIGQSETISNGDAKVVKSMYNCP